MSETIETSSPPAPVTYTDQPLSDIAEQFGAAEAVDAQRGFDDAHDLLDTMAAESGATVRVERFTGQMGMFNLHQLQVHLTSTLIRRQGGLRPQQCLVSED